MKGMYTEPINRSNRNKRTAPIINIRTKEDVLFPFGDFIYQGKCKFLRLISSYTLLTI